MLRIGSILHFILQIFLFTLLGRLIFDYVRMFKPSWRPSGIILILIEAIYTITDRPMNFVRRFVPPLRLGGASIDLSFIVLFFAVQMLMPLVLLI
jgi:YggT family protein